MNVVNYKSSQGLVCLFLIWTSSLPEHLSSSQVFVGLCVAKFLVFYVM